MTWDDVAADRRTSSSWRRAATTARPQALTNQVVADGLLPAGVDVYAVDADGMWARPGPRLVDGIEELAEVLGQSPTQNPRPPNQSP